MPEPSNDPAATLAAMHARVTEQVEDLRHQLAAVVAASESANLDDEHDPEGQTVAFERQQLAALLDRALDRLAEIDAAKDRVATGTYGRCEHCGQPIAEERLAALPTTTRCVRCAQSVH
jgi:RNA polymerase-binding transcription factor DksA